MKNLISFWIIVTIIFANACTKSGIENDAMNSNKIKLSSTQVEVDFEGKIEHTITVNSPCSWEAESKNDWLKVITTQGVAGTKELSFYAQNNYDLEKREGTIVVINRDYGYIDELYVTQKGFIPSIQYPETMTFDAKGDTQNITITANCSWDYSDNANWLSLYRTNSGLKVSASECTSTSERTAEIIISNSSYNVEKVIKVTQKAFEPSLEIDKTELNFDFNGGSSTVFVTTNAEFDVSEYPNWISCYKQSNRVTFTISASNVTTERTADVKIHLPKYNIAKTVKITQKEFIPEFEVKISEVEFEAGGGGQTIPITANFEYSISETAEWLYSEITSSGVTLVATANVEEKKRTTDVKIYNSTYGKSVTIKVTQKEFVPEFEVKSSDVEFEAVGGEQTIPVTANFEYSVSETADWLYSQITSNGVRLTAVANVEEKENTAEVKIYSNKYGVTKTVYVKQKKFVPSITIDKAELSFEAEGGTQTIPVSANFEYTVSANADWLSYKRNGNSLIITVNSYDITENRNAEVIITNNKYNIRKIVTVVQSAFVPKLDIDKAELEFEFGGGTQVINVITNAAEYSVSESSDWITCTKNGNSIEITAQASTITETRSAEVTIYLPKYNLSKTVAIKQKLFVPSILISDSQVTFGPNKEDFFVYITANFTYSVISSANWLSHEVSTDGSKVSISASQNMSTKMENRTATITIYNQQYNISKTINITQNAFKLGDIVDVNGVKGVVYLANSTETKIVSVDETHEQWDAAKTWCDKFGYSWDLPSVQDLKIIQNNLKAINSALSKNQYTIIYSEGKYWSNDEDPLNPGRRAYYVRMTSGCYEAAFMNYYYDVRATYCF